jgi:hypothetical protein
MLIKIHHEFDVSFCLVKLALVFWCGAGDPTLSLVHAWQVLCHGAASPASLMSNLSTDL